MAGEEKVVARFKNGTIVKGYLRSFRMDADTVRLRDQKDNSERILAIDDLKALFFVKTFKGYRDYMEKKAFGTGENQGCKVFIKFGDRESIVGHVEGNVPWDKGFSLGKLGKNAKGFFIVPVDSKSNNNKIFVVGSAINDISIMMA